MEREKKAFFQITIEFYTHSQVYIMERPLDLQLRRSLAKASVASYRLV